MWTGLRAEIEAMFSRLSVFDQAMIGFRSFHSDDETGSAGGVERVRAWRRRNPARSKAYDAARYAANREARKAQARAYYATKKAGRR